MPTTLITGASGGIGYELAKLFARDRHNLVLVARSADKLGQVGTELKTYGVTIKTIALDLAAPHAPKFLFDQLQSDGTTIGILVNNAGYGTFGDFAQMPEEEIRGQIDLNITALTQLTRLFLPAMIARHSGRIMNVASTAGFQPGPLMAVYYATKAFVISFSEAIANELQSPASPSPASVPEPRTPASPPAPARKNLACSNNSARCPPRRSHSTAIAP